MWNDVKVFDNDILSRQNGTKLVIFRNFSCKETVAKDGRRFKPYYPNFTIIITKECAEKLLDAGFDVREYTDRDGETQYKIKVNCRFDKVPPKILKECGDSVIQLDMETIKDLDRDEIIALDLVLNLSNGGACYVRKANFTIDEDEFDKLHPYPYSRSDE